MYGIRLIIFCILIKICCCSYDDIFKEWAEKKEEPSKGYGYYRLVPLYLGECTPSRKKDPDVWINVTSKVEERKNKTYNIEFEMYFPGNIRCVRIYYEIWLKMDKKIRVSSRHTANRPCTDIMTFILFKFLKVIPPCTVMKENYKFVFEDIDKIFHTIFKFHPYARFIGKMELFSPNGEISCHLIVADMEERK